MNPGRDERLVPTPYVVRDIWNETEDVFSLALEPEVILLDEPCSGLDPISTMKVEEALTALKEDHSIVIVPHNVQQASRIGDKAAFLLMGELVEHGTVEQVFTRPRDPRTDDYITGRFG